MCAQSAALRKTERLEARIPRQQKVVLARAAAIRGQSLTDFVLASATAAAHRIIRESEVLQLSEGDQAAFAAALVSPPKASPRLKRAARIHGGASR